MIAKIAQIRDDHTWSEMEVRIVDDGFSGASSDALAKAREVLDYDSAGEFPENIIALHVLGVEEAKASCLTHR